jgi:hypothetical protein
MKTKPDELTVLRKASQALAQAKTLDEIKLVRDKAEAARKYAQSAAMGLQIQNYAAELKLRAERKAGKILAELPLRGGDRKSNSRDESLKLMDLGIDHNQSARWQLTAQIPEPTFVRFLTMANEQSMEITTASLLRLARKFKSQAPRKRPSQTLNGRHQFDNQRPERTPVTRNGKPMRANTDSDDGSLQLDHFGEVKNHIQLLTNLLLPYCNGTKDTLTPADKRVIKRLLSEMNDLLLQLQAML